MNWAHLKLQCSVIQSKISIMWSLVMNLLCFLVHIYSNLLIHVFFTEKKWKELLSSSHFWGKNGSVLVNNIFESLKSHSSHFWGKNGTVLVNNIFESLKSHSSHFWGINGSVLVNNIFESLKSHSSHF